MHDFVALAGELVPDDRGEHRDFSMDQPSLVGVGSVMKFPDKPTTPQEWSVITWTTFIILAGVGIFALWRSFSVADCIELRATGYISLGLAVGIVLLKRLIDYWLD